MTFTTFASNPTIAFHHSEAPYRDRGLNAPIQGVGLNTAGEVTHILRIKSIAQSENYPKNHVYTFSEPARPGVDYPRSTILVAEALERPILAKDFLAITKDQISSSVAEALGAGRGVAA